MTTSTNEILIDAAGRPMGRVASAAAVALRGKQTAAFTKHLAPKVKVKIVNAGQIGLSEKKKVMGNHARYSGYPGGFRRESFADTIAKKGYSALLREAIHGMLPNNKLRPGILKNLTITE